MDVATASRIHAAVIAFRAQPAPDTAELLLQTLSPYRGNAIVSSMIDQVLDYRFLVGTIPAPNRGVMSLDTVALHIQSKE
jgi:hypothetical protein